MPDIQRSIMRVLYIHSKPFRFPDSKFFTFLEPTSAESESELPLPPSKKLRFEVSISADYNETFLNLN